MDSRMCSASGVNEARKELFAQDSRSMENIPPILLQHVRRTAYQGPRPASSCTLGWLTSDSGGNPFGLNCVPEASTADVGRAAGVSANTVRRIYSAQNSANVAEYVATTCSS